MSCVTHGDGNQCRPLTICAQRRRKAKARGARLASAFGTPPFCIATAGGSMREGDASATGPAAADLQPPPLSYGGKFRPQAVEVRSSATGDTRVACRNTPPTLRPTTTPGHRDEACPQRCLGFRLRCAVSPFRVLRQRPPGGVPPGHTELLLSRLRLSPGFSRKPATRFSPWRTALPTADVPTRREGGCHHAHPPRQ